MGVCLQHATPLCHERVLRANVHPRTPGSHGSNLQIIFNVIKISAGRKIT